MISFDPTTKAFSSLLPYRTAFTLDVPTPKTALGVGVSFWPIPDPTNKSCATKPDTALHLAGSLQTSTNDATQKHFQVTLPALHANTGYCISIDVVNPWSDAQSVDVASDITDAVAGLATTTKGSFRQDELLASIRSALGSVAGAQVQNQSGQTVEKVVAAAIWGKHKIKSLSDLEKGAADYYSVQKDLQRYVALVQAMKDAIKVPNGANDKAVQTALTQMQTATTPDTAGPAVVPPTALKDSVTALVNVVSALNCASVVDPKAKDECSGITAVVSNAETKVFFGRGAIYVAALTTAANTFATASKDLSTALTTLIGSFIVTGTPVSATPDSASYTQAAPLYISGDVGVAVPLLVSPSHSYGADVDLYVAVSVSFIAVDKDVPLAKEDSFLRRFSLLGGFTLTSIKSSDSTITGVLGGVGILGGAGLRLTDYVRVGGGAVFLRQNDTDKLITDTHVKVAPYLSLSIDLDVAGMVTGIFAKGAGLHI